MQQKPHHEPQQKHFLYATDGSRGALAAARFLSVLPHSRGIHVHILTVLDDEAEEDGGTALNAAASALGAFPGHVTTATGRASSTGPVTEVILETARYIDADLIAVGSRGLSPLARFFLGSVAQEVVRHAACPVLVAREPPPAKPLRDIVAGVDGSPDSAYALEWAVRNLPLPLEVRFRLVRVMPPAPAPLFAPESLPLGSDIRASAFAVREEQETARQEGDALAAATGDGAEGPRASFELCESGDPATALIAAAERYAAGLIVVGARGLSGLTRVLLGSVSERVLHRAHCSVLIVHRPHAS